MSNYFCVLQFTAVNCGMPRDGIHSNRSGDDFTYNKTVNYTCETGHEVSSGNAIRTCQADKTWTGHELNCSCNIELFVFMVSNKCGNSELDKLCGS